MEIKIPYNGSNLDYISYMSLTNQVVDNSDVAERLIPGQFTRMTLRIQLNDAYLFSYNKQAIPRIVTVELNENMRSKEDPTLTENLFTVELPQQGNSK